MSGCDRRGRSGHPPVPGGAIPRTQPWEPPSCPGRKGAHSALPARRGVDGRTPRGVPCRAVTLRHAEAHPPVQNAGRLAPQHPHRHKRNILRAPAPGSGGRRSASGTGRCRHDADGTHSGPPWRQYRSAMGSRIVGRCVCRQCSPRRTPFLAGPASSPLERPASGVCGPCHAGGDGRPGSGAGAPPSSSAPRRSRSPATSGVRGAWCRRALFREVGVHGGVQAGHERFELFQELGRVVRHGGIEAVASGPKNSSARSWMCPPLRRVTMRRSECSRARVMCPAVSRRFSSAVVAPVDREFRSLSRAGDSGVPRSSAAAISSSAERPPRAVNRW